MTTTNQPTTNQLTAIYETLSPRLPRGITIDYTPGGLSVADDDHGFAGVFTNWDGTLCVTHTVMDYRYDVEVDHGRDYDTPREAIAALTRIIEGRIMEALPEEHSPRYTTKDDLIEQEIVRAIEASGVVGDARQAYDVDRIAHMIMQATNPIYRRMSRDMLVGPRFYVKVDHDEFWEAVATCEYPQCPTCGSREHVDCTPVPPGAIVLTADTLAHLADMTTRNGEGN